MFEKEDRVNSRLEEFLELNPLLGFELSFLEEMKNFHFPKVTLKVSDTAEVLIVKGVMRCSSSLEPFLKRGGLVVFVEANLQKLRAFIEVQDALFGDRVRYISASGAQFQEIACLCVFKTVQFIGDLPNLKEALDQAHLFVSDYRDFGKTLLLNVQKNLLRTQDYVDGRDLKGLLKNKPIIICGSGPSLDEHLEAIRACAKNAVILATGSAIPKLVRAQIPIDFGAFVEPNPPLHLYEEYHFPLFYQNRMSHELLKKFRGPKIWMGDAGGWPIAKWLESEAGLDPFTFESGWNVGNFGLALAEHLGCDEIYLVGLDSCMKPKRALKEHEYSVEGQLTRRDLHRGITWMKEFIAAHPHIRVVQAFEHLTIDGAEKNRFCFQGITEEIDKSWDLPTKVLSSDALIDAIGLFHNVEIQKGVEAFLERLKNGVDKRGFAVAKLQFEACLLAEPIYDYLLAPLWDIFEKVYMGLDLGGYPQEVKENIAKAQFFLEVLKTNVKRTVKSFRGLSQSLLFDGRLEGKVIRRYPSGKISSEEFYVDGEPEGIWTSYYESGKLKSSVSFAKGDLHGLLTLFHEVGQKREGLYEMGKKVGVHKIWSEENRLVFEGEFDKGVGVGSHRRYNYNGRVAEEIEHLDVKRFNKKIYTKEGALSYEGFFKDNRFVEKAFHKEKLIHQRMGMLVDGGIVWD